MGVNGVGGRGAAANRNETDRSDNETCHLQPGARLICYFALLQGIIQVEVGSSGGNSNSCAC